MLWRSRAERETRAALRTWFGTLTLSPAAHQTMVSKARARLGAQGVDFDALPYGEQFRERHREISREITKYLKRVRKESGELRFLMVAEHHKSGLPHYHLLVHERDALGVKHRTLSTQWKLGFEKWRLLTDLREASYLCKYLAKATVARVRASGAYGEATSLVLTPEGHRSLETVKTTTTPNTPVMGTDREGSEDGISSRVPENRAGELSESRLSNVPTSEPAEAELADQDARAFAESEWAHRRQARGNSA